MTLNPVAPLQKTSILLSNVPQNTCQSTPPPAYSELSVLRFTAPTIVITLPDGTVATGIVGSDELARGSLTKPKCRHSVLSTQSSGFLAPQWKCQGHQQSIRLPDGYIMEVFTVGNRTCTRMVFPPSDGIKLPNPRGRRHAQLFVCFVSSRGRHVGLSRSEYMNNANFRFIVCIHIHRPIPIPIPIPILIPILFLSLFLSCLPPIYGDDFQAEDNCTWVGIQRHKRVEISSRQGYPASTRKEAIP